MRVLVVEDELRMAALLERGLREEGYAAVAAGDTATAIRAFQHYLALKTDPDAGPAQAERDSVRATLQRLTHDRRAR